MVSYECRKLDLTDAEMIMRMNQDFRKDFVTLDGIRNFLKKDENWMFAAVDGERIIGFVYGYELCHFDGKGTMLYLHEVGVMAVSYTHLDVYKRQVFGKEVPNVVVFDTTFHQTMPPKA